MTALDSLDTTDFATSLTVTSNGTGQPEYGQFINGAMQPGTGSTVELNSRIDGRSLGVLSEAGPNDVAAAYNAAESALASWRSTTPAQRVAPLQRAAALFRERVEEVAHLITHQMGKPPAEARMEVEKGAAVLDYYAQSGYLASGETFHSDTGEQILTIVEPLGIVALITPWNFPFTLPIRKISAALATGNTILLKPAGPATLCALAIAQTLHDAGLPEGVLNVVNGPSSQISKPLLTDSRLGAVSVTGSYQTAVAIHETLPVEVPLQAELGGKNALLVWHDADVDTALEIIVASAFRNNGQICTSAGRVLVHEDIADRVLDALQLHVQELSDLGAGDRGVLATEWEQTAVVQATTPEATAARDIIRTDWDDSRLGPAVIVEPTTQAALQEEIFGPVVTFERISTIDEAVTLANTTEYGLTAGIVTNDLAVARQFWESVNAGTVKVNTPLTGTPYHVPFQGFGRSGAGDGEGGTVSLKFFTRRKAVYLNT